MAALAEPLRDGLVRRVVARALRDGDRAAASRLTHQVETARETFAGVVLAVRSLLVTAVGVLAALGALAPSCWPPSSHRWPPGGAARGRGASAGPPPPGVRGHRARAAAAVGRVTDGQRDLTAAGAEDWARAHAGAYIDAECRAARALARWELLPAAAVGVAGRLPVALVLVAAPWLLGHGATAGALVAALLLLHQSLLPELQGLARHVGAGGFRPALADTTAPPRRRPR
ncbi:hypothetical protein NKH77_15755 [Streptomyces sp. M19]